MHFEYSGKPDLALTYVNPSERSGVTQWTVGTEVQPKHFRRLRRHRGERSQQMSICEGEWSRHVIAFDGDDTLWVNDSNQQRWENECRRREVEGLPHPGMSAAFRRYLREFGCLQGGVARALHSSCRDICEGELPPHWSAQVQAVPEMARALNLRHPKGVEGVLEHLKRAGHPLWLITKGDLIRQAIKLSCFPLVNLFDVVEIVDRKNAATYRAVLAANDCPSSAFTMVGDAFWEDAVPVVRLGGRAIHVPIHRSALSTALEKLLPAAGIHLCYDLDEVPDVIAAMR
jgi:putative hydrolase of the HAD superfamily